ncbi:sacsin N-terminal ATP-binding-like domain-containing protein [Yinghuangia seranimata]|uniref:sacsin N-terminal ATP-binding-like domain-containing protein n=1 Tax=Yinghuangia seranimata TaxID=408067 RepID=UPI00248C410F|nr:hypothetical protein [Yinghuangia seranimata]MDI2129644.1 hypothetical protein [Yinghuangia seranimata]
MSALRAAVFALLDDPSCGVEFEPSDTGEAAEAVRLLDAGLRSGPAAMRAAVVRTQETADSLSGDRLQVFAELIQNADDAGARAVRFELVEGELRVAHDGRPVRFADVLLLGLPGLSGKAHDPDSTGRFGIGLATVRALSRVWEVHAPPWRVRFDGIGITPADPLPGGSPDGWTVFRIPLDGVELTADEVGAWFAAWDDSALLFLRSLRVVTATAYGRAVCALELRWPTVGSRVRMRVGACDVEVRIRRAQSASGVAWRVYDTELPMGDGLVRRHKAGRATVPVAVALPSVPGVPGVVHAALPMAAIDVPVRVHAHFDPLVSRRDFVAGAWNDAMVGLVADLWAAAVPGVLGGDMPAAWHLVPGDVPSADGLVPLAARLREELVGRARGEVAGRLRLACSDGVRRPLAELAVEERRLEGVVDARRIAWLAGAVDVVPAASRDGAGRWRRVLADWRAAGVAGLPDEVTIERALGLYGEPGFEVEAGIRLAAVALQGGLERRLLDLAWVVGADGERWRPPVPGSGRVFVRRAAPGQRALADVLGTALDLHAAYRAETAAARTVLAWLGDRGCVVDADDIAGQLERVARIGDVGRMLPGMPPSAEALGALRGGLGQVPDAARRDLGPRIGRALRLRVVDGAGRAEALAAPGAAYLPAVLDPAPVYPFADAARDTPGLRWLHPAYADELEADGELDPVAFLRLLGVADAPRLTTPRTAGKVYATDRHPGPGLPADGECGTTARTLELGRLGADHTLEDRDSPDAVAVAAAIGSDPDPVRRRRRAVALIHTLARAYAGPKVGRRAALSVEAAYGYYGWHRKGRTVPVWIWRLRELRWLDRADGTPTAPDRLYLPTSPVAALFGREDPGYLHTELHEATVAGAGGTVGALCAAEESTAVRATPADSDSDTVAARGGSAALDVWAAGGADDVCAAELVGLRADTAPGAAGRAEVLRALGVVGSPGVGALIARLRELRDRDGRLSAAVPFVADVSIEPLGPRGAVLQSPSDLLVADVVAVYRALAGLLVRDGSGRGEAERAVRVAFGGREALVLTGGGWRRPAEVLQGPSILGGYRTFVLPEAGLRPLWDVLGIREPDVADLTGVLAEAACDTGARTEQRLGVTLEALRRLAGLVAGAGGPAAEVGMAPELRAALRRLPLRCGDRWTARRPVYAVDNRYLAEALGKVAPVWQPGGDLQQFTALLRPLGVTRLEPADATVVCAERSRGDTRLTAAFRSAVVRLQDTLVRDEPDAAAACVDSWWLSGLTVRVLPGLTVLLALDQPNERRRAPVELTTEAHIDRAAGVLYVASAAALETGRGAGQAVAAHFARERTRVGHVWRDVWEHERLDAAQPVAPLPSARQRDDAGARHLDRLLRAREEEGGSAVHRLHSSAGEVDFERQPAPDEADRGSGRRPGAEPPSHRRLVDLAALAADPITTGPDRPPGGRAQTAPAPVLPPARTLPSPDRPPQLPAPHTGGAAPQQHAAVTAYTPQDRETAAWELLRRVLARDGVALYDHRSQPGLGADAVDAREHFYEIKAHAGPEPREVTLTVAEFERALTAGERFSLVVAANLEAGTGRPRLRIITDPLRHLSVERTQGIKVTGLLDTDGVAVIHEWDG